MQLKYKTVLITAGQHTWLGIKGMGGQSQQMVAA